MEIVTQADLRLEGIGIPKIPHSLSLTQSMNHHGILAVTVWLEENEAQDTARYVATGAYVILTTSADHAKPIFCGVISSARVYRKEGRHAAELEVRSYSWLMDRDRKKISYQQSGRTWKALTEMLLLPYGGIYTWDQPGKDQPVSDLLIQYEETDWEFLCRMAARQSYPVSPEVRVTGVEICVGLPQNRESREIGTDRYRIRSGMDGA